MNPKDIPDNCSFLSESFLFDEISRLPAGNFYRLAGDCLAARQGGERTLELVPQGQRIALSSN
ncbi:MAG: hypothetical protein IGR93_09080 [Hydrococcus sp. C42_A2020_068]|nr:hypothetical protein [Hydrococcus sp. C42_A2020_068]